MPRRSPEIRTEQFADLMSEALIAWGTDLVLAVGFMETANKITGKRRRWAARIMLREASESAVARCSQAEPFVCTATSGCGLGTCPFATGVFAELTDVPSHP